MATAEQNILLGFECSDNVSEADKIIRHCLDLGNPQSFFLRAGAGSGKTHSLTEALKCFKDGDSMDELRRNGKRIGVITYTNAACDEIRRRIRYDPVFCVSTIHSFAWDLINPYTEDIREWLKNHLKIKIEDARVKTYPRGREARQLSIQKWEVRLATLAGIRRFVYSPDGDNLERGALEHSEVLKIAAYFLREKETMRLILTQRFPFLLIDECQDTDKTLLLALIETQKQCLSTFAIGLFGDSNQRVYFQGLHDLERHIPDSWWRPVKKYNFRSGRRVVELINRLVRDSHAPTQEYYTERNGCVRLFVVDADRLNGKSPEAIEEGVRKQMATFVRDPSWGKREAVKTLVLEHHMAAQRHGFLHVFDALGTHKAWHSDVINGKVGPMRIFHDVVMPLYEAIRDKDEYRIGSIVMQNSPLFEGGRTEAALEKARNKVDQLRHLWRGGNDPTLREIAEIVGDGGFFRMHDALSVALEVKDGVIEKGGDDVERDEASAILAVLDLPFSQFVCYHKYVHGESCFATHQGVKGLEFERVMVVIDDGAARGFMFKYGKFWEVAPLSGTDRMHIGQGEDNAWDRARRLFYVVCSRAKDSLAIVYYSSDPDEVRAKAIEFGWFREDEVVRV